MDGLTVVQIWTHVNAQNRSNIHSRVHELRQMNTIEYLDAAMRATESKSDYQLAAKLGISRGRVSDYRHMRIKPDEYACTRIAVALGIDPVIVIGEIALEWEKRPERRDWWRDFLRYAGKASAIAMVGLICTSISPTVAQAGASTEAKDGHKILLCAIRAILRFIRKSTTCTTTPQCGSKILIYLKIPGSKRTSSLTHETMCGCY